jgi:hypothetical protein
LPAGSVRARAADNWTDSRKARMNTRIVWITALVFTAVHLAVSNTLVFLAAATSHVPEGGMAMAASATTFPLAGLYDRLLDRPYMPAAIQLGVPIVIGALVYGAIGAAVGCGIDRILSRRTAR